MDADPGTFNAVGLPTGLSIDPNSGVISGAIGLRAAGSYAVRARSTASDDGFVGSTSFTWTVNDTTPPALTNPGNQTNNEGDTVSLAIQAVDADPGTFNAVGLPTGLSINPTTGVISGTLAVGTAGVYAVTVTASDNGVVGSVAFSWSVAGSKTPTLANPGPQTSVEGAGGLPGDPRHERQPFQRQGSAARPEHQHDDGGDLRRRRRLRRGNLYGHGYGLRRRRFGQRSFRLESEGSAAAGPDQPRRPVQ